MPLERRSRPDSTSRSWRWLFIATSRTPRCRSSELCTCLGRVRCLSFSTRTRTDSSCTGSQAVGRWRTSWPTSTESLRAGRREYSMPNRLAKETSPYLRQHAENPVDWYPWGEEAFHRAREEDKPIHLSVGYAACRWCHVMANESFENPDVARIMNERFVNIKVDVPAFASKVFARQPGRHSWPTLRRLWKGPWHSP